MNRMLRMILVWILGISFALMMALGAAGAIYELIPGRFVQLMHSIGIPFSIPLYWTIGGIDLAVLIAAHILRDKIKRD